MKISTCKENHRASNEDEGVLILYCAHSADRKHIKQIGRTILDSMQYTEQSRVYYKTDEQTHNGANATGNTANSKYWVDNPNFVPVFVNKRCITCDTPMQVENWKTKCISCYYSHQSSFRT